MAIRWRPCCPRSRRRSARRLSGQVLGAVRPVGILQRNTRPSAYHPRRVFAGNAATVLRRSRKGAKDGGEFAPGCSRKRGRATAAECAGQGGNGRDGLGISVETLSRRLSEEGTSFAGVVDQLRESLALRYLKETGFMVAQIAWLLGYERPTAFKRASSDAALSALLRVPTPFSPRRQ
jgi:hypothetical protein